MKYSPRANLCNLVLALSLLISGNTSTASELCSKALTESLFQQNTPSNYLGLPQSELRAYILTESRKASQFTRMEEGRGLSKYNDALGKGRSFFEILIENIKAHKTWLDVGGGNGLAIAETISAFIPHHGLPKLKSVLISYDTTASANDQMQLISGKFFEDIPNSELPSPGLITDVYGAMSYSMEPHTILQKYWDLLLPGGKALIYQGANAADFGKNNKVITQDGQILGIRDWALQVFGKQARLSSFNVDSESNGIVEMNTLILEKDESTIEVPELEIIDFEPGLPPTFIFREKSNLTSDILALRNEMRNKSFEALYNMKAEHLGSEFLDSFRAGSWSNSLITSLSKLKSTQTWLNVSPKALAIGEDLVKRKEFNFDQQSDFLWIDQKIMEHRARSIDMRKFRYIGKHTLKKNEHIGKVDLITDFNGDLVTQYDPVSCLKRYAHLLNKDGKILIAMGSESQGIGLTSKIRLKNGNLISLRSWLVEHVPGIKAKFHRTAVGINFGVERSYVEIQIKDIQTLNSLPELGLVGFYQPIDTTIPVPLYQEK